MKIIVGILVLVFTSLGGLLAQQVPESNPTRRAELDLKVLSLKLSLLESFNGRLPTNEEGLNALVQKPVSWDGTWYQVIYKLPLDPWGHPYHYKLSPERLGGFDVSSFGPDGVESSDDIHSPSLP